MKIYLITLIINILLFMNFFGYSQNKNKIEQVDCKKQWFVFSAVGVQISGIKKEDFIKKNVSPAVSIGIGLWFTPEIALSIGYNGPYFNTIADSYKHYYNYTYGEVILNLTNIVTKTDKNYKWNVLIHPGAGFFNNMYYGRPNVCLHLGLINSIQLNNNAGIYCDISAIAGWDIYQNNDDILPSIKIGMKYTFI